MVEQSKRIRMIEPVLHIAAWILVLISPVFLAKEILSEEIKINYLGIFVMPIAQVCVFYVNYLLLIPKLLFNSKIWQFIVSILVLIITLSVAIFYVKDQTPPPFLPKHEMPFDRGFNRMDMPPPDVDFHRQGMEVEGSFKPAHPRPKPIHKPKEILVMDDVLVLIYVTIIAVLLRYTKRWFLSFSKMKELEKEKIEVELKNLKTQLNPHFLFNTLNNIYALIGIQQDKAQQAVLDLSKLLRYALYEGQQRFVTLDKEVEFIDNYIKLMNLRLANSVNVSSTLDVGEQGNLPIAQMLFIALVENAYKHGVSLNEHSYINIRLEVSENKIVTFTIENSSFPKNKQDKSGSGIGIDNLKRRLELLYPEKHSYSVTSTEKIYKAELKIDLSPSL